MRTVALAPLLAVLALALVARRVGAQTPTVPAEQAARVEALLRRMTLEEKVGQMTQVTLQAVAAEGGHPDGGVRLDSAKLHHAIAERHVGSILNVLDRALTLDGWHAIVGDVQRVAATKTRLGIPIVYGVDAVHGTNYTLGSTIFPHDIGLGATFDTALARRAGEITGREVLATGVTWNFAPVLDAGRQPLWPRFYETFGESPLVGARLGEAMIVGMQSSGRVAATMKHYLGYGIPRSGRDRTPTVVSERIIREQHLPQFRAAVDAGAMSVMVNSGEIDGEPVHASRYWLTDVLRGELGFDGVIVTDWEDVHFLHTRHRVAPTIKDAVRMAVEAGIDMSMTPYEYGFADHLLALVREGTIPESRIDASVRRILMMKAKLGLFENAHPNADRAIRVATPEARADALRAAQASVTLLENRDGALPLARGRRVLVAGPAATSVSALHGGWSYTWQGSDTARYPADTETLLDAIRRRAPQARHVAGSGFTTPGDVAAAVAAARESDVVVLALGEEGYAEWVGDLDDLTLPRPQLDLARALIATGKPVVLVLLEGRPRLVAGIADSARAVVMGYWPGAYGAEALAQVLFGEVNPSGRLPFTYPRAANALLTHDHKYTEALGAGFDRAPTGFAPQWPFGHGLSYTTFAYGEPQVARATIGPSDSLVVRVTVTNTGTRAGQETVLLYTRQHYRRLTPPVRELRGFQQVSLAPGASRTVTFTVPAAELGYLGRDLQPVLEPGAFDVMVGGKTATFELRGGAER